MKVARQICTVALLFCSCSFAFADTFDTPAEIRQFADKVMGKVGSGEVEAGLGLMKPYIIIPAAEFDVMLEQVKLQKPVLSQRFGKSIGSEFIREDKVGENLIRLTYALRFEKHPMRWVFYFYRGKTGWLLNTFRFDDDIRQLFSQ